MKPHAQLSRSLRGKKDVESAEPTEERCSEVRGPNRAKILAANNHLEADRDNDSPRDEKLGAGTPGGALWAEVHAHDAPGVNP